MIAVSVLTSTVSPAADAAERQLTHPPQGHLLTNIRVWSPDGNWIVYDVRSDAAGDLFDGNRIEAVNVHSGEVRVLYESKNGAHCGVVTWHPLEINVAFILGPENPTTDWQYAASHRQGVIVDFAKPGVAQNKTWRGAKSRCAQSHAAVHAGRAAGRLARSHLGRGRRLVEFHLQ
jgi:hypothetical protein